MYSARRVGGRRLYELARRGVEVERSPATVTVHGFTVLKVGGDEVEAEIRCSPGTYVRALARDLGTALGFGGHLTALRRIRSGDFTLDQAVDGAAPSPAWRERMLSLGALLTGLPAVRVGPDGVAAVRHGRDLTRALAAGFPDEPPERIRVLDEAGDLLALAVPRGFADEAAAEPVLHPEIVLAD